MKRDELLVPGEYHSTPDVVMARRDITSTAKCVYSAILSHLRAGDEWVWPSIPRIVAMTGTPRRSVIRATGQLEDAGLLERGEHGRSTRYRFLNPLPTPVAKAVPACPQTPPKHCAQQCHSGTGAKMAQVPKTTGTGAKMAQTGAKMAHQALKETLKETL